MSQAVDPQPVLTAEIPVLSLVTKPQPEKSYPLPVAEPLPGKGRDLLDSTKETCQSETIAGSLPQDICFNIHPQAPEQLVAENAQPAPTGDSQDVTSQPAGAQIGLPPANGSVNPAATTRPSASPPVPYWQTATPFAPGGDVRRGLPAPLDPVFPSQEWVGQPVMGAPDTDPVYPLEKAIYQACPALKKARIKIYGWGNPGWDHSSSNHSNIPLSYAIVPNRLEMEQLILRIERTPDTVQTEHMDWGFRVSNLFGTDYRWTTAQGWYPASNQLLSRNMLYGYDPVECWAEIYYPKIAHGAMLKVGRYISPPDIEAQLSPDNYLWTHSIMFTYDCYTHTGIQGTVQLNDQWMLQTGIHSGADMAPWSPGAIPTLECYLRWVSKSNNDSVFGGVDSLNNGRFRLARETVQAEQTAAFFGTTAAPIPAHDNLQQFNITWGHRFSRRIHMQTEAYYLYTFDALQGGTVNNGPSFPYNALTGPGAFLPGLSTAWGFVNYTLFKITDKDYIAVRPVDYLIDPRGWRTGFPTTYSSWTIGWTHRFSDLLCIRPEIRYERALSYNGGTIVTPFDNGTRRFQFTFGMDLIQRF
jgi:hypothetical protein